MSTITNNEDQSKIDELYRDCEELKDKIAQLKGEVSNLDRSYYTTLGELEMLCALTGLRASEGGVAS